MNTRNRFVLSTCISTVLAATSAQAAVYTWDSNTVATGAQDGGGAWNSIGANWLSGGSAVAFGNTSSDTAVFGVASGSAGAITVTAVTANGITFNAAGSGNYTLAGGTITLDGASATLAANANATIASVLTSGTSVTKSGTGILTLDPGAGATSAIANLQTTAGGFVVSSGSLNVSNNGAAGGASGLYVNNGTFTVNGGVVTTSGYVTVKNGGTLLVSSGTFVETGAEVLNGYGSGSTVTLGGGLMNINVLRVCQTGASTVNLNGGMLQLTSFNFGGGTGTVNFNGSTVQAKSTQAAFLNASSAVTYKVQAGGAIFDSNGYAITLPAPLVSGTANDGGLTKLGAGTLTLSATNTYVGPTTVTSGTLQIGGTAGMLAGAGNVTVGALATLVIGDSTAANNNGIVNRINPAAALSLGGTAGGATVSMAVPATTTSGTLASVALNGGFNNLGANGATGTTNLAITGAGGAGFVRNGNSVLMVTSSTGFNPQFTNAPTAAGGSAIAGTAKPILIGASLGGNDLVSAAAGTLASPAYDTTWTSDATLNVTGGNLTASTNSVNALRFNESTGARTVTLLGTGATVVQSGMILVGSAAGNGQTVTGGTLTSGNGRDLIVWDNRSVSQRDSNAFNLSSIVADNGTTPIALTVVGASGAAGTSGGQVWLNNNNTFTGGTVLLGGEVDISSDTAFGAAPVSPQTNITVVGGGWIKTNTAVALNPNRNISLATGSVLTLDAQNGNLTIYGAISGAGNLTSPINRTNLIVLNGTNAFTGYYYSYGTLRAVDGIGLPAAANLQLSGNSITAPQQGMLESSGTFTRSLGTGAGQVQWVNYGGGGFGAYGAPLTVALGGTASPTSLTWGAGGFVFGGSGFELQDNNSTSPLTWLNPINLNGAVRTFNIGGPATISNSTSATMSGVLSNGGVTLAAGASGPGGLLVLTASNTYTGQTQITQGVLRAADGAGLPPSSNLNIAGGAGSYNSIFESLGGGNFTRTTGTGAGQVQFAMAGSLSAGQGFSANGGPLTVNLGGSGATIPFAVQVLGITGSVITGTNTVAVSSTNGLAVGQVVCGNGVGGLKISSISPGSITMSGNAWATIPSNALTFVTTSNTAINGSILVLNEVTADSALTLVNGLDLNGVGRQINVNANTAIISGAIVNSGGSAAGLTKAGAGTLALTAANTYDGGTTITTGTLQIGNGGTTGAIGATSGVSLAAGATLAFNRTDDYGGSFSRVISGSGGLVLTAGTLTLAGANTFTGDTVLNGGTLTMGIATALQKSTLNYNNQGGIISFETLTAATLGGLNGSQSLALLNASGTGVNLSVGNNNASTIYTGLISGTNSASTLTKIGTGTLSLDPGAATSSTISAISVNGGILAVASGTTSTSGFSVNGAGIMNLTGGTLTANQNYPAVNGIMNISGGTFNAGNAELLMAFSNSGAVLNLSGSGVVIAPYIRMGQGPGNTYASTLNLNGGTLQTSAVFHSGNVYGVVNLNGTTLRARIATTDFLNNNSTYNVLGGGAILDTAGNNIAVQASLLSGTAGDGGLSKNGAGTLTLSGSNSYTGVTAINAGTLSLASASALAGGGAVTFGGGTLQFSGSNTNDYSGRIVNSGSAITLDTNGQNVAFASGLAASNTSGLTVLGNGTLTLSGSSAYTGATTVSSGTLQINGVLGQGSYAGAMSNAGALIFGSSATQTLSGAISGTGSLMQSGPGTLTLTGSNSYTGATTVNGGILQIGDGTNGSLAAASAITISSGGTLALNLANSGTFGNAISNLGGVINLLSSGTSTVTANLSGYVSSAVNQNGTGTTILTGNNGYYGPTNINAGVLQLGYQYAAYNSTVNLGVNNGLAFGVTPVTIGGLSGTSGFSLLTTSGTTGVALTIGYNNQDSTYTGTITGTSGAASLTKLGAGTFTYAPVTSSTVNNLVVNQGKFLLAGGTVTAPSFRVSDTGVFEQTGGTLISNPYPSVSGAGGATLNVLGGNFQGATELLIGFGTGVPGTVNVSGSGTLSAYWLRVGNGSNASVNLNTGGVIQTARFYTFGGGSTLNMDGGTIRIVTQSRGDFLQGLDNAYIKTGGVTFDTAGFSSTVAQPLQTGIGLSGDDGGLRKIGAGTLTLSGSNSYNGGTSVNAGTLQLGNANGLGASTGNVTVNGGTLDLNGNSATVGTLSGSTGAVITTSSNASVTLTVSGSTSGTFAGVIQNGSGTVGLAQAGTGNLTLAGANTYTGDTTLSSGTLTLGTATALQNSTVNYQGGTLSFGSQTSATLGGLEGAQTLALLNTSGSGVNLSVGNNNASTAFTGLIAGTNPAAVLTKTGAGTLTLDPGAASANTLGSMTSNAGALVLKSGTFTNTGTDPSVNGYAVGVGARGGTLTIDGATLNVASGMLKIGAAANGNINILGGTISDPWDFVLGHNGTGSGTQSGGTVTVATMYHQDAGSGSYTLTGGTLATRRIYDNTGGANAFTLNLNGGTLKSTAGTTNLIDTSGQNGTQVTVLLGAGNTIIDTTDSSANIVRPMADMSGQAGAFTKAGTNTLTLSGSNSHSGGTTVSAGVLKIANANALGTGSLTVNGGTLNLNGNSVSVAALSGAGGVLTNTGSGTGMLTTAVASGTSTYAGNIVDGTGGVALTKTGVGTLVLDGSCSMAGLNADDGIVSLARSGSIGAVTVGTSGTLAIAPRANGADFHTLDTSSLAFSRTTGSIGVGNDAMVARATSLTDLEAKGSLVQPSVNGGADLLAWEVSDYGYMDYYSQSTLALGDVNGDGIVDGSDYRLLDYGFQTQVYGVLNGGSSPQAASVAGPGAAPASPEAVPEPGTWGLLVCGLGGLLGGRRRKQKRSL